MKTTVRSTKCRVCRAVVEDNIMESIRLLDAGICFLCDFWLEKWRQRKHIHSIRIDGHQYWLGPEEATYKAHGGKEFHIYSSGPGWSRVTATTNLWHQGRIPQRFRHLLPDNAKHIKEIQ